MESLWYIGIMIFVISILGLSIFFKRKYNIKDEEVAITRLILGTIKYISTQFNYANSEMIEKILFYVIEAIGSIEDYENTPLELRDKLIKEKTIEICKLENIPVDETLIDLIGGILEFLALNEILIEIVNE